MRKSKLSILIAIFITFATSSKDANAQTTGCNAGGDNNNANLWSRGGNNGPNNIFGTLTNGDLNIQTNGTERMIINGAKTPTINNALVNTTGYVGIGTGNGLPIPPPWDCTAGRTGPWSLLHLQGLNNTPFPTSAGWRSWMKTGMYVMENSDNCYFGLKNEFAKQGTNRSDAVINWGDDANGPAGGPDNLRFIFTNVAPGNGSCTNCPLNSAGFDGAEIARMTPQGNMGVGNFYASGIQPFRRLEILDDGNQDPQLRLTGIQNANPASGLGTYTDFMTSTTQQPFGPGPGNLFIDPRNGINPGAVMIDAGSFNAPGILNPQQVGLFVNGQVDITGVNQDNTITRVLVWDNSFGTPFNFFNYGRVKWRDISTIGLGTCNTTPTTFLAGDNGAINLGANNNNFYFEGNNAGTAVNNVMIGKVCGAAPQGKLDVRQSSSAPNSIGIYVENTDFSSGSVSGNKIPVIGIKSLVSNSINQSCYKVAGWFESTLAPGCSGSASQYSIFVPNQGGTVSLGFPFNTAVPGNLLQVNGPVTSTNPTFIIPSDRILKKDTSSFKDGLNVIRKIHPIVFKYNGKAGIDTSGSHIGVIAENMQTIAPYTVSTFQAKLDSTDANYTTLLNFNASPLIYTSINAIKQLDSTVTALKNQLAAMQSTVNNCCNKNHREANYDTTAQAVPSSNMELANKSAILFQNFPNPFGDGTVIRYFVPENSIGASIIFYDEFGNEIKNAELPNKGQTAELNLSTMNLSGGIYSYSLVVNGKIVDTKRMVKTK